MLGRCRLAYELWERALSRTTRKNQVRTCERATSFSGSLSFAYLVNNNRSKQERESQIEFDERVAGDITKFHVLSVVTV